VDAAPRVELAGYCTVTFRRVWTEPMRRSALPDQSKFTRVLERAFCALA